MKNTDLLAGKAARAVGRRRRKPGDPYTPGTEQLRGADPTSDAYDRGRYPLQEVKPIPTVMLEIVLRRTGVALDPDVVAELERVRLFLGWQGFPLTPELQAERWLEDPKAPERPPAPEPTSPLLGKAVQAVPHPDLPSGFDPLDLGDG